MITGVVAVLASSLIGGCGDGQRAPDLAAKPSDRILAASADALRAAGRFRVIANVVDGGGARSLTGDFHLQGQATQVDIDAAGRGYSSRRLSRDETYLRVDAGTLQANGFGPAAEIIADRWFRYSVEQSRAAEVPTTETWASLVAQTGHAARGSVTRTRLGDQEAVRVTLVGAGTGTVYIAAVGPPYPLRMDLPSAHTTYRFSEFGRPFPIEAPVDATDIDQAFPTLGLSPFAGMTPAPPAPPASPASPTPPASSASPTAGPAT